MWAFTIVGATGLLLGFQFRVPAVLAASMAVTAATLGLALLSGQSLTYAVLASAALLVALQGSYLLGLVVAIGCGRATHNRAGRHSAVARSQYGAH